MDGQWSPDTRSHAPVTLAAERPNIFRLYEENIGPLTPIITDNLRAAEDDYSPEWIEDAIRIAVEKNVRNWRYIDAILRTWQEKGRNEINRRNQEENRRRYIEGDYADLIQH
jgi:DnaD/phage-associated family protein